eukprot:6667547-Karenia_brevis.AAC.1
MAQDFTDVLVSAGMKWKPSSLEMLATASNLQEVDLMLWQCGENLPIKHVVDMEVLGCMLSASGDVLTPVRH